MPDVFVAKNRKKRQKGAVSSVRQEKPNQKRLKHPKTHKERKALPGHTHNPLAAYRFYPERVNFVNKDPEEKVILLLRRHPITNLRWIFISCLMLIAPSFLPVFSFFDLLPERFQLVLVLIWYLLTTAFIFEKFLGWYFNVNIVTDERIIEVDFFHLVYREMTDANIDQIQDVTVEIGSAIRTMFNYGNVIIQTAAQVPRIEFEAVPKPDRVAKVLRELRIEEEVEKLEGRVR